MICSDLKTVVLTFSGGSSKFHFNLNFQRDENIKPVSLLFLFSPDRAKITHASDRGLIFAFSKVKHSFDSFEIEVIALNLEVAVLRCSLK